MKQGLTALALALMASGCASIVSEHHLRPDYNVNDRMKTKRVIVVTEPSPDGNAKAGELWSTIAQHYVNLKRNFIVKDTSATDASPDGQPFDPRSACVDNTEGVLWLQPTMHRRNEGFDVAANGKLLRCSDGEVIWRAAASGYWLSKDPGLTDVAQRYVQEVGPESEPYVVPSYRLLKAMLDTLPDPILVTEDDKNDKLPYSD